MSQQAWQLVADIGGTNARFAALQVGQLESEHQFFYTVAEHADFIELLAQLRRDIAEATGWVDAPQRACLAVACPADGVEIKFTNSHWHFSKQEVAKALESSVEIINDFAAIAHGVTELGADDVIQVGGVTPQQGKPMAVLGPGTGLGVSALIPHSGGYAVVDGEGGHVGFAPGDARQAAILVGLQQRFGGHVSAERLLSGRGIVTLYQQLAELDGVAAPLQQAADITAAALSDSDPLAIATLHQFCQIMGTVAGDVALNFGAKGGVYLAGGVIPRFSDFFSASQFREYFQNKGRFADYLAAIPVYLVVRDHLGLLGAAKHLNSEPV